MRWHSKHPTDQPWWYVPIPSANKLKSSWMWRATVSYFVWMHIPSTPLLLKNEGCEEMMRELLGMPKRVIAARQWGFFLTALFAYESFTVTFETGIDHNLRFDAHIQV